METKKRHIYLSKTKRIFFHTAIAVTMGIFMALSVYFTYEQFLRDNPWLTTTGFIVSLVMISLFGVSVREANIAIQRRGYSRPIGTNNFERVVKSIFPHVEPMVTHPSQYKRSKIIVRFDGDEPCEVNLSDFYFVLLNEQKRTDGILNWNRCVVKGRMNKKLWAAYRKLLVNSGVCEVDGRGSIKKLNCEPWSAVEVIKERC